MACACSCDRPKLVISPSRASAVVFDDADDPDHLVEVVERDAQPFEDVGARLGLAQLELGATADDFAAELDELLDELEEVQHLRPAARRWPA